MCQLIESIQLKDGRFNNLRYHELRMNHSLKELYGVSERINLLHYLSLLDYPRKGVYKCRLLYDGLSRQAEFQPYTLKPIASLKLIFDDALVYNHKYADRSAIDQLVRQKGECNDILIVKNGWVTDCSYANIVFKSGNKWYTPDTYLLRGTMRESLLETGEIEGQQIKVRDINKFEKFKLVNAMLGFEGQECDISNIFS